MKKIILTTLTTSLIFLASCKSPATPEIKNFAISEDKEFGGICIEISINDFMKKGFKYGDSCDVVFSNGVVFEDMPYYDGYYVRTGENLVVGYQGYEYIELCKNNSTGFYKSFNFPEGTTASVKLSKKGKFLATQEALSVKYSDDRNAFESDTIFANFRTPSYGNMGENVLFRGASPVNNQHKRAKFVNDLIAKNNINFILDLADSEENMTKYFSDPSFESAYAKSLYDDGKVTCLGLNMGYTADTYAVTVADGMKELIKHDGPYYIHCTEGKDRTGFAAIIMEALMGATEDELEEDYMITYDNYYGITKEKEPNKYKAIVDLRFKEFVDFFNEEPIVGTLTLESKAYHYLQRGGMTEAEIDTLKQKLSGSKIS